MASLLRPELQRGTAHGPLARREGRRGQGESLEKGQALPAASDCKGIVASLAHSSKASWGPWLTQRSEDFSSVLWECVQINKLSWAFPSSRDSCEENTKNVVFWAPARSPILFTGQRWLGPNHTPHLNGTSAF